MHVQAKILAALYGATALIALVFTWWHIPEYLGAGFVEANKLFWKDALFNSHAAGRFLVADVLILAFACSLWMLVEGRRLKMRFLYAYIAGGIVVAISVAFPLFMAVRTLKLAENVSREEGAALHGIELAVLALLAGITLAASVVML